MNKRFVSSQAALLALLPLNLVAIASGALVAAPPIPAVRRFERCPADSTGGDGIATDPHGRSIRDQAAELAEKNGHHDANQTLR